MWIFRRGTNAALGIEFAPSSGGVDSWSGGVLAVGVYESDVEADDEGNFAKLKGSASDVDQQLGGILSELAEAADFKGKTGSSSFARTGFSNAAQRVGVVGLGKSDDLAQSENMKPLKQLGGALADDAKASKKSTAAVYVPSYPRDVDVKKAAAAIAQGTMLAAFNETRYKQSAKPTPLTRVDIIKENSDFSNEIKEARSHAEGIMLTKELVNGPAEHVTPTTLEETFKQVASKSPNTMHLTVLGRKECEQRKMEPFLAVGRGSAKEPKFIHLQYTPQGGVSQDAERIALVGKGITYDAGGINIKPSQGGLLEVMKFDMGGAGAVAGAASIIADSQPKDVVVDFIVPACENMVDADSFRPGDILTASNGKTIEITNTDAEGRLVLSEGMLYANELGATKVVDIATLTGAMLISLGSHLAGYATYCTIFNSCSFLLHLVHDVCKICLSMNLAINHYAYVAKFRLHRYFTNSDELSKRISEASKQGEDRVWQVR